MIENLVFKGRGLLGVAYAAAISVMESRNIMKDVKCVAGSSSGSVMACLLALKYTATEIKEISNKADYKSFEDGENPFKVLSRYGLYFADAFLSWMRDTVARKGLAANATFADFNRAGCLDLGVFTTDLNLNSKDFLSKTHQIYAYVKRFVHPYGSLLFFKLFSSQTVIRMITFILTVEPFTTIP